MLQLWHESISLPFHHEWADLDLALAIPTEPYLLIDVANMLALHDQPTHQDRCSFDEQQCRELDQRHPDLLMIE